MFIELFACNYFLKIQNKKLLEQFNANRSLSG